MSTITYAQNTGSVAGKLTDKEYNDEPLAFANILIKGTTKGTTSGFDGIYTFNDLEAGTHTLIFSFVGYETQEIPVTVVAEKAIELNVPMSASAASLNEVIITTTTTRESETALLLEQKKSVEIKTAIGSQELSKKAVSNAAGATLKVTGVNKKEGSSKIYVRGLGDRYNTTTLNGLPLPSNDPRNKNIDLSLFGSDIIQNIGIGKAFSSYMSLDLAGANIDIQSKETTKKSLFKVSFSTGANTQTTFKDFKEIDGANWFGVNSNTKHDVRSLKTYSFENGYSPDSGKANPNLGLSLNYGKKFTLSDESNISIFLVGTFSNKYSYQDGISDNIAAVLTDGSLNVGEKYNTETYNYSASKMLMNNVAYKINNNHKLKFNHLFIHSNSQRIQDFVGTNPNVGRDLDDNRLINKLFQTETQNRLFVNQLISENKFGESIDVNAGLSYNAIYNDEPDRRKNTFIINNDTNTTRISQNAVRDNSRFYGNLFENVIAGNINAIKYFGERYENKGKITLGYDGSITNRKFDAMYFDHNFSNPINTFIDINNFNSNFSQESLDNGLFRIETSRGRNNNAESFIPTFYDGEKMLHAAYVDAVYKFNEKFTANVGIRAEDVKMNVNWNVPIALIGFSKEGEKDLDNTYLLPTLNFKYQLNKKVNLRASSSITYTYPQFKEFAPFTYEDINSLERGNPGLIPSDNYNGEVKLELFPNKNELISIGIFGKVIQNSINRFEETSAVSNSYTFINAGDATVFGVELEGKLNIFSNETDDDKSNNLTLGGNTTIMKTEVEYDKVSNSNINFTGNNSQLEGAAPITVNADISYRFKINEKETISTLIFNYQSDKVYSIASNFKENVVEKGVPLLDFVFSHKFNKNLGIKFNAKNLLNSSFERYRDINEKPTMISYKKGISISAGINYSL